ncbi:DUF397 domain-containing protein [Actinomadura formosensis]|uniref:DUF397 domain-containing protein n=1 Tax=Actinomadura formosensis TaxID=60706 RepID=UPI0008298C0C|nr:DUF397 domain-containing protein [Actinomadura formosensis]
MPHRRNDRTTPPTAPDRWRVSSHCGASNTCIALAPAPAGVAIRDQADPTGPTLNLTRTAFANLLNAINPRTDCPNCRGHATVHPAANSHAANSHAAGRWRCGCGHRWTTHRPAGSDAA